MLATSNPQETTMLTPTHLQTFTNADDILAALTNNYIVDEHDYVQALLASIDYDEAQLDAQKQVVADLIGDIRKTAGGGSGIDSFLQEYSLDTEEGIVLMCIAEALLRIPDAETADALICQRFDVGLDAVGQGHAPRQKLRRQTQHAVGALGGPLGRASDSRRHVSGHENYGQAIRARPQH